MRFAQEKCEKYAIYTEEMCKVRMTPTDNYLELVHAEIELHVAVVFILSCRVVHKVTRPDLKTMKAR